MKARVGSNRVSTNAKTKRLQLLVGAGGIYASFLYYGTLQEDVFAFKTLGGEAFKEAWFLQAVEASANIVVGFFGMKFSGATPNLPKRLFAISGLTQVSAKAFTSVALASGLSFPVATLAKSGKAAPVMMGSLVLGGAKYSIREYSNVAAIIIGTVFVNMGKKKKGNESGSSFGGLAFIILSLICDGVTGGVQKRLKKDMAVFGVSQCCRLIRPRGP